MRLLTLTFFFGLFSCLAFGQNSALSFDGGEEFLTIPHDDAYNIGDNFTVEAWIFAQAWTDQSWQGSIVAKDAHGAGVQRGFAFRCGSNGALSFVMAASDWQEAVTGSVMNTNQWHHVAAVVGNGTITLYIDGQPSADHAYTGAPSHGTDLDLHIGSSAGFGGRFFNGVIDEVRIWNTARTQTELVNNSTMDLTGSEPNLVFYLPLNEGTGTSAGDISPNGSTANFNEMDETNWVTGYTLPNYDISVQSVSGVDVVNMIDRPVKMKVGLQNTGTEVISNIDLAVSIDGELYNTETVSSAINAGDLLNYEFILPVDLIGKTDPVITVEASQADDGNVLNNIGTLALKTGSSSNVIVADEQFFNVGTQNNAVKMTLPNDLHRYEQILLNIDLTCPTGGCGDWDVLADLKAITGAGTFELARYITPYGIACGGWQVDVTDFKSVLGGEIEFITNITVFTQAGWLVNMSMDLIDNNPQDTYSNISKMWEESYHVYGDPGIEDDLSAVALPVMNNTETNHVRMTITGHGQGNTNNAAEFYNVTHNLNVDGSPFANHNLWKDNCDDNPCSNQSGNWLFPRAGWCPGEAVIPFVINTTAQAAAGSTVMMDYEFQDYTNLLNTGYNNSTHTEPYYRLYSYFIENSSTKYIDFRNLAADNVMADSDDTGTIPEAVVTFTNNGLEDLNDFTINIFYDGMMVATETFNEAVAVGASVEKTITLNIPTTSSDALFAEVSNTSDDNPGDNVVKTSITTSTNQLIADYAFEAFPNPTSTGQLSFRFDQFWNGSTVNVYHANGVLVNTIELSNDMATIQLTERGVYLYTLVHPTEGTSHTGKVVFLD